MKTTVLFFACLFFSLKVCSQNIENADFETWVTVPNSFGGMDPQGWRSTNAATAGANIKGVSRSTDKYSGTYALALSPLIALSATDTITSAIVVGFAPLNFTTYKLDYSKGGQTFTTTASSVNGYYKFSKGASSYDSAYAMVLLKDATGPGYKGIGNFGFTPLSTYIPFQVDIVQQGSAGGQVDSLVIAFFYKSNNQSAIPAAKLLIDSLHYKIAPPVATMIKEEQNESFSVSPNPFTETIDIKFETAGNYKVEIFSVDGQLCRCYHLKSVASYPLSLPGFEKGIYFICCTDLDTRKFFRKSLYRE